MNQNRSAVDFAYDIYDGYDEMLPPLAPIVIIHGLFDCKENWRQIAENIAERLTRKVYVIDLKNHGVSPRTEDASFEKLVDDIETFLSKLNEPAVVVAHSIGGSGSCAVAFRKPSLIQKLILIDVSPIDYPSDAELNVSITFKLMQEAIQFIPKTITLDQAKLLVEKYFENTNMAKGFQKLILTTLIKTENGIDWKTYCNPINEYIIMKTTVRNAYPLKGTYNKETLFVYGGLSSYIRPQDHDNIRKVIPRSTFVCIPESNHWIHMEKPSHLIDAIVAFLKH